MTSEKFRKLIESRANQRVQAKISTFRDEIEKAVSKLFEDSGRESGYPRNEIKEKYVPAVMAAIGQVGSGKYPAILWDKEEAAVEKELLSIMDEMQKALLSLDSDPGIERPIVRVVET